PGPGPGAPARPGWRRAAAGDRDPRCAPRGQRSERGRGRALRVRGLRPDEDARALGAAGERGGRQLSTSARAATATGSDLPGLLAAIADRPRLAALLGAMSISFSGIFYRWAEVSPSTGTFYRCLFGLPFLAAVAYVERRKFGPLPRATVRLALIAGVFFAGDLTFWHHAIEYVGAGLATVLGNLQVLVVALVAWAAFGERPPRSVLVALPIVLLGVVLISGVIGSGAYGAAPPLGVALGLLTAMCYAGYLLIIRRGGRDLRRPAGPVAVSTLSTTLCAAA